MGVPSCSDAQVRPGRSPSGSARIWRRTRYPPGDQPGKRTLRGKGRERLGAVPGQRAAQGPASPAQAHGDQGVVAGSQARPGEAQQQAALVHETRHPALGRLVEGAHIGEDQHRDLIVEELPDGFGHSLGPACFLDIRERGQGAGEIVGRGQERLRLIVGAAEDQPDAAALAALVHQRHRAGRALGGDLEPADAVAEFHRKLELNLGFGGPVGEAEIVLGQR